MKLRLKPNEVAWFQAYERMKTLPNGTKFTVDGIRYKLVHVFGDPHPPSVELSYKEERRTRTRMVRRGDALLTELHA